MKGLRYTQAIAQPPPAFAFVTQPLAAKVKFAFVNVKHQDVVKQVRVGGSAVMDAALDDVFADDITIPAADGYPLAATLFLPRGTKRHAVLVSPATAAPRKISRGCASYLAHRGCAVLTFDYRGIGGSRQRAVEGYNQPKSLAGFKADMADWALLDVKAAVAWMRERYHNTPLGYVGHSFGGQVLGLLPNNSDV